MELIASSPPGIVLVWMCGGKGKGTYRMSMRMGEPVQGFEESTGQRDLLSR